MKLTIRRAGPGDLPAVLALLAESARWMHIAGWSAWPATGFPESRLAPSVEAGEVWVMIDGDRIVATVTLDQNPEAEFTSREARLAGVEDLLPDAWIGHKLAADRAARGAGYGALLVDWTVDWAFRQGAKWRLTNVARGARPLQGWYRKRGFVHLATVTSTRTADGQPRKSGYLMYRRAEPMPGLEERVREIP